MLKFTKVQGTGNDFIVFDLVHNSHSLNEALEFFRAESTSELAAKMCQRGFGVGADGLLVLSAGATSTELKWDFFNSDGSPAEMCGNAARCVTTYWLKYKSMGDRVSISTSAGIVQGVWSENDLPKVSMTNASGYEANIELDLGETPVVCDFVNTGVPHAVVFDDAFNASGVYQETFRKVRNHEKFAPEGANVTGVAVISEEEIASASYERGVENFTLSCGTGAVAAAYCHLLRLGKKQGRVVVNVPGGEVTVHVDDKQCQLEGPAEVVYEGEIGV